MAKDMRAWADSMRMDRNDARDYEFCPMDARQDPISRADCIQAYLAAMESQGVAGICRKSGMDYKYGLLITGPEACGKHTAATAIVASLLQRSTYTRWVWLTPQDFADADGETAVQMLSAFFLPYVEKEVTLEHQPSLGREILLLERPEECACGKLLLEALSGLLQGCRENELAAPLVILVTRQELREYAPLRKALLLCRLQLPSQQERFAYLGRRFACVSDGSRLSDQEKEKIRIHGATQSVLADRTAGMNYRQLEELVYFAKLRVVYKATAAGIREASQFALSDFPLQAQELLELLGQPAQTETARQSQPVSAEELLAPLLSQLSGAIANMGTNTQSNSTQPRQNLEEVGALISDNSYDPGKRRLLNHTY